jgi:hypothetical protein
MRSAFFSLLGGRTTPVTKSVFYLYLAAIAVTEFHMHVRRPVIARVNRDPAAGKLLKPWHAT